MYQQFEFVSLCERCLQKKNLSALRFRENIKIQDLNQVLTSLLPFLLAKLLSTYWEDGERPALPQMLRCFC